MKKPLRHRPLHLEEAETDRRGVDEELRQVGDASNKREQPLYSLGSNSSDTIVIVEADGTASYLSPSVKQILGYRSGDLLGKNIFDHIHPEDAPDIWPGLPRRSSDQVLPSLPIFVLDI